MTKLLQQAIAQIQQQKRSKKEPMSMAPFTKFEEICSVQMV
jgi:hypothetical protein